MGQPTQGPTRLFNWGAATNIAERPHQRAHWGHKLVNLTRRWAEQPTNTAHNFPVKTFHNPHHALHHGQQEMFRGRLVPCHEVPARLDFVLAELQRRPLGEVVGPRVTDAELDAAIACVHTTRYTDFLVSAWPEWVAMDPANAERDVLPSVWPLGNRHGFRTDVLPDNFAARLGLFAFDAGSPLMAGTWAAARGGAACALAAAREVLGGADSAFALTRPPGHHAGPDFLGGYCFLNNAAIAAQALVDGGKQRVAVLDVDYHHGNGTQTIFYERADVLTISIHGDPAIEYPFFLGHADERGAGVGEGFNLNLPLPRGTGFDAWRVALDQALQAVNDFGADALVVPMGLDTFEGDPISGFTLQSDDYFAVGEALASAALPTVFTFEGGYAVNAVGVNAVNLLEGFTRAAA
jgi:acetoin utilization deacetylase AcuC-like enzyme